MQAPVQWLKQEERNEELPFEYAGLHKSFCGDPLSPSRHSVLLRCVTGPQNNTSVLLAVHHDVCDGIGAVQCVNDILQIYDNLRADDPWDSSLRKLDFPRLHLRNKLGIGSWHYLKHLWKQPIALAGLGKFLLREFAVAGPPLTRVPQPTTTQPPPPVVDSTHTDATDTGLTGIWISTQASNEVEAYSQQQNVSVNSIFMASVFHAVKQWNANHGWGEDSKWFRMILPISLRSKDDLRLPATNRATIVQLDRNCRQMSDRAAFVFYIDREVKIMVAWQFHKLFLMIVRMMSVSRFWLRWSARNQKPRGTIVFTNLGEPFRAIEKKTRGQRNDDAMVTDVVDFDCGGPIRNQMPVNFTLQKFRGRYRISARYDSRRISAEQAHDFLELVKDETQTLTGAVASDH